MGAWLSTERLYNTATAGENANDGLKIRRNKSKGVQVATDVSDERTQTPVPFTDRLTDYGAREIGSTETFDHVCDICDKKEKEAVGFCKRCEQYYCLHCCRVHEKLAFTRAHGVVGKDNSDGMLSYVNCFERQLVPVSVKTIPMTFTIQNYRLSCNVQCLTMSALSEGIIAVDCQSSHTFYLKVVNKNRNVTTVCFGIGNVYHMIVCLSGTKDEVLLTAPKKQEVWKCSVDKEPVKPVTYFKTSGQCWGIAEFDKGFAVSVKVETGYSLPDWQVQFLDPKGEIKKQIYYDNKNQPLFSKPEYLASNHTQDTLYVSDNGKHAIIALDVMGTVLFTFSHYDLWNPMALTADDEDNVYVACGENVIQIHKSGAKHRKLIQKTKDNPEIRSVCFNPVSRALIVGEASYDIKTFNFLP